MGFAGDLDAAAGHVDAGDPRASEIPLQVRDGVAYAAAEVEDPQAGRGAADGQRPRDPVDLVVGEIVRLLAAAAHAVALQLAVVICFAVGMRLVGVWDRRSVERA